MVKHMWIITGGTVDVDWLRSICPSCQETKIMAADRGLFYAEQAGLAVDYILGDFDSLPEGILDKYRKSDVQIRTYPPEKDYTDTHLALLWAVEEGAEEITIIGGMGTRFDHSFANIGLLSMLLEKGVKGEILDPHNRIFMMDKDHSGHVRIRKQRDCEEYISLIPYTEQVTGITLNGFKYPLKNETLTIGISRGISNELIKEEGLIQIEEGILIICVSKDS
ncbi:MAG: thiamine diphosphokinase [Lachnospiraceae bacterium]|nr:thiamine diphosphokinase [Lachnospiraceae bacterium]